ncbi:lipase [Wenjunlia vitaminophila]|uniref:Lipase n=1 Tax=Wenjunlia vitaminophila TaxID=76728 RepID=A0A0T6LL93_WENVI|nr:alpha/beta hydrolase [Wenjunlia vitaminophila]KRV46826.1 lipase [Wenjunlia vitaminophila]
MADRPGVAAAAGEALSEAVRGRWAKAGKQAGVLGVAVGVVAAGAVAGVAAERLTVGRSIRRRAQLALDVAGPYGSLRGTPGTVVAEDGTVLSYETDPAEAYGAGADGAGAAQVGPGQRVLGALGLGHPRVDTGTGQAPSRPPLTAVFCHGYALNQDSFHFQRQALRGRVRSIYWDQRSHGRSQRGVTQGDGTPATIDELGRDLKAVLDAAVPEGPVVLVGHSMGGMTIMAFADQFPEFVRERVAGVAFLGTTAGGLGTVTFGLPAAGARTLHRVAPGVLRALGNQVDLVERGRRAASEVLTSLVKRYSFGSRDVDPAVVRFAQRMLESTPIDVVAEFYPAFAAHEKTEALAHLDGIPVLILAGERDLITPLDHSAAIAAQLPGAELVPVKDAAHMALLERPELVNAHLAGLLVRAADRAGAALPEPIRALAATVSAGARPPDA